MINLTLERAFIQVVEEQLKTDGLSNREFALKTFINVSEGSRTKTWERIRDPKDKGKPRDVTLDEAEQIATSLGQELEYLLWKARTLQKRSAP